MWEKLKKFLEIDGKAVIVEDGEPRYVVMPADEYLELKGSVPTSQTSAHEQAPPPQQSPPQFQESPVADSLGLEELDFDAKNEVHEASNNEVNLEDLL